ncbi:TPA: sugar ABC transporter permease [Klebsiella pneumoniae]|nr:sugar ABC transporter permease [Klebsiella pneumoniae]
MNTRALSNKRIINPSFFVMGSKQILRGYYVKGISLLTFQILFFYNVEVLFSCIKKLGTLGTVAQHRNGFEVIDGDNSIFILVEGVLAVIFLLFSICLYLFNIRDARGCKYHKTTLSKQLTLIYDKNFSTIMLTPAFLACLFFILTPVVITVLVSFTNYSSPNHIPPKNLVDWVGAKNYLTLLKLKLWSKTFVGVGLWTISWALLATMCTCSFGFLLALALENKKIKGKKIWRVIFILPYAIPTFVTLLVFRLLFNGVGPINNLLNEAGFGAINFLSDPVIAKFTVILASVWVGAPYFMLLITGAMTNIPRDLYEASEVDGANKLQQFFEITLPMVLNQVAPSLVMTFAHNFNNFGAIYLLTEGGPINPDYRFAGHTDILITWIYKLTLDFQQYQIASVISIVIFLFLSAFAIWQFKKMKSFKEDVGM